MGHIHSVYDTDKHFTIDPATRLLVNQNPNKNSIMQFDHNSERITFDLPRMVDGHDMMTCNRVEVHYLNIDAQTKESKPGLYEVDDLAISPAGEDTVICSWLVSRNATQLVGPLWFRVTFHCVTEADSPDYSWSTAVYKGLSVADGINNSDWVAEEFADILEQWRDQLLKAEITDERLAAAVADYMGEHPVGESIELDTTLTESGKAADAKATGEAIDKASSAAEKGIKDLEEAVLYLMDQDKTSVVKSVNGKTPDANGNVEITIPDSGGNVDQEQIEQAVVNYLTENPVAGGMTKTEKNLILTLFRNAAYTSAGMNPAFTQLETLWNGSGEGGGDVHSHSYTSSITTAATCTTAGVKTYTCNCGHSYTESIPATGHNYVDGVCTVCGAADPTYTPGVTLTSISAVYNGGSVPIGTAVTDLTGIVVTAHYSNGTSATVVGYTLSGTIAEGNNTITVTYEGQTATFVVVGANVLTSISASYSGGSVPVGTAITELTGIVVTAHYSDGTSEPVTAYTMTGTIGEGSNTITVNYGGKTTSFTVVGVYEVIDTSPVIAYENLGIDANGQTVDNYIQTPLTGVCITKVYEYAYDNAALKASKYYDSANDYSTLNGLQGSIQQMTPSAKNIEAGGMSSGLVNVTKTRITADGEYVCYTSNNSYNGTLYKMQIPRQYTALVNAQKVGFEFVVFKPDADDSYAYWHGDPSTILPIGVQHGDIIFAGKNTKYYGMRNISQYTGE